MATILTKQDSSSHIDLADALDQYNANTVEDALAELGTTKFWNGFDRSNTNSMGDLSWDATTRELTIDKVSGQDSYYFWVNGKKVTKTSAETVTIPDTAGTYYIYFNGDGDLSYVPYSSATNSLFWDYALVGFVYWNHTESTGFAADERHGIRMSGTTHMATHFTVGARYGEGLDPDGLTAGSTDYTQVTAGSFWDEDIEHSVDAALTHKFMWREGSTGEWKFSTASNKVAYKVSGDTYYSWNEYTGSTWQLKEGASDSDYWINFFVTLPNISGNEVVKVIGQNAYASRKAARNAIESEMLYMTTSGLPNVEIVWLYAVIVKRDGKLQALSDGSLYFDLRHIRGSRGVDTAVFEPYEYTPSGSSDTAGEKGDIAYDDSYIYVKTDAGWARASLSSF